MKGVLWSIVVMLVCTSVGDARELQQGECRRFWQARRISLHVACQTHAQAGCSS
jgi:hypothetical protein